MSAPPNPPAAPPAAPDYLGFVEHAGATCLRGWAIDRARLPHPAQVAAMGADGPLAIATADAPRPDVALAGFPAAACGFELRLPPGAPDPPCVVFWPDRVALGAVEKLALRPPPAPRTGRHLGIVSTWHAGCGIAAYAATIAAHLAETFAITVLAADHAALLPPGAAQVEAVWHDSDAGLDLLCERISALLPERLLIEHHPGLLAWPRLGRLIEHAHAENIAVHLRLHTLRGSLAALREIRPALRLCASILLHTQTDISCLEAALPGLRGRVVPHGVAAHPRAAARRIRGATASFHIGAFGFMQDYKGIEQHLRALHLLRPHVPNLRATLLHAITEHPASAAAAVRCFALRQRLGLDDIVTLDTRLLPMAEAAARLEMTDVLVFAYQDSAESASGAACALAGLGVPILATPCAMFKSLGAACHMAPGADEFAIAAALRALAGNRAALRATLPRLAAHARENAWARVAHRLAQILAPEQSAARPRPC